MKQFKERISRQIVRHLYTRHLIGPRGFVRLRGARSEVAQRIAGFGTASREKDFHKQKKWRRFVGAIVAKSVGNAASALPGNGEQLGADCPNAHRNQAWANSARRASYQRASSTRFQSPSLS